MARKTILKIVSTLPDASPVKSSGVHRPEFVPQYEEIVESFEAAPDGPKRDEADARYLETFPGDLERARRLGVRLDAMIAMYVLNLADVREPDKSHFLRALAPFVPTLPRHREVTRPERAPRLWADRDTARKTNPAQFTRKVYGKWIAQGMSRKDLRDLDEKLYHALSVWEHRHPEDTIKELPTLAEVIDRKIASLSVEFDPDELRKLGTTLQTRLRRSKK